MDHLHHTTPYKSSVIKLSPPIVVIVFILDKSLVGY
nr:MAG TPA: hypothetical protein [Caudoviricetes sp.]